MENLHLKSKEFLEMMQMSRQKMPFDDFDEMVMVRIKAEVKYKASILTNARLSALFFLLGIGAGFGMNNILSEKSYTIFGMSAQQAIIPFQLLLVIILLLQLENIYRLFIKHKF